MAKLAVSILASDFANLERDIHDIQAHGADWVHVDVMDGLFVPNITIGPPVVRCIRKITGLPFDVHLMIDRPIRYAGQFLDAGADWLTVHVEADTPENIHACLDIAHARGRKAGIVLKPGTPAEAALPFLEKCDLILVMTVEPGFGAQSFMHDMLTKLRALRAWLDEKNPECLLEVDGGINFDTAKLCKEAGAAVLVSGSAYFRAEDRSLFARQMQE